jgi:hypothetical protein
MQERNGTTVALYAVKGGDGSYFAGFDPDKGKASFVVDPREGKLFSNKYDIRLRPDETIVELTVDLSSANVKISEPFRPHRRFAKAVK